MLQAEIDDHDGRHAPSRLTGLPKSIEMRAMRPECFSRMGQRLAIISKAAHDALIYDIIATRVMPILRFWLSSRRMAGS